MRNSQKDNNFQPRKRTNRSKEYQTKEGAWKLAYADFMTAMMCFFMLMWLLNTTPSQKLQNMANYFQPTVVFFNKKNSLEEEKTSEEKNEDAPSTNAQANMENDAISKLEEQLKSDLTSDPDIQEFSSSIATSINSDGLEISIFDNNKHPMFEKNSAQLTDEAKIILAKLSKSLTYLPNRIVISGYTEKVDGMSIDNYGGWNISAARSNAAMKVMQIAGLPEEKIAKLVAYGDNVPLDEDDPYSPRNRRITITVLAKWSTVDYKSPISKSVLKLDK